MFASHGTSHSDINLNDPSVLYLSSSRCPSPPLSSQLLLWEDAASGILGECQQPGRRAGKRKDMADVYVLVTRLRGECTWDPPWGPRAPPGLGVGGSFQGRRWSDQTPLRPQALRLQGCLNCLSHHTPITLIKAQPYQHCLNSTSHLLTESNGFTLRPVLPRNLHRV